MRSKWPPKGPKGLTEPQNSLKIASKWVKMARNGSKWLKLGLKCLKMGFKCLKTGAAWAKLTKMRVKTRRGHRKGALRAQGRPNLP